jgi:phosphohistidine phosphatase
MKLYFLRHGIAANRDEWSGDDASRPLTSEGRKCMEREAKGMEDLNVCPDRIITSPLKRAKETAQIVAERLHLEDKLIEDERLAGSFDAGRLAELLRDHKTDQTLMLVGHEPDFSETIGELIGGASLDLKKGGLARIDLDDASAKHGALVWLIPPKALMP